MLLRRLRATLVLASCFVLVDSCSESTAPSHGPPAQFDVIAGDAQVGVVGMELSDPLTVRLTDANGITIAGQLVNFRVTAGGGSVFAGSAITNSVGIARERFTLGTSTADSQVVQARAVDAETGAALVLQEFRARAIADVPASATVTRGAGQSVAPSALAPDTLSITVKDKYGNPVPGLPVDWTVSTGGGAANRASDTTSAAGVARTVWTAPTKSGSYVVTATPRGMTPVPFTESVTSAAAAQMTVEWSGGGALPVATTIAPAVRILDAFGNPVSGTTVTLTIASGNGRLASSSVVTDADGRAQVSWTLGTVAGVNTLRADAASLATASLTVTGTPGAASTLTKLAGDNQTTLPATAVPIAPAVRVADAYGNPIPGVSVSFSVTSGGGSLAPAVTSTDNSGTASLTSWTLGASRGTNTLQASTAFASLTFTASGVVQSPDITVNISEPSPAGIAGDSLAVVATVTSVRPLASVRASVGAVVVPMTFSVSKWTATVPLSSIPRDSQQLVVTATDISGAATEGLRSFIHDRPPQITIITPVTGEVARPSVSVSATCADDDPAGCSSMTVTIVPESPYESSVVALTGGSSVSGTVSLAAYGPAVKLMFTATDSRGQSAVSVTRWVYVEGNSHLVPLASATNGTVWDYRNGAMLVAPDMYGLYFPSANGPFDLENASTGVRERIPLDPAVIIGSAFVGPRGAILSAAPYPTDNTKLFDYRDGQLATLADVNSKSFVVEGGYAAFVGTGGIGAQDLYRRDLTTGEDVLLSSLAGSEWNSVTAAGDVAFWDYSFNISLYRAGTVTQLTSENSGKWLDYYPATDGQNVVFAHRPAFGSGNPNQIVLLSGGTTQVLATGLASPPDPRGNYAARNGWVAFTKPEASGVLEIWTRAPDGTLRQASAFGSTSLINALGDDGSVVFTVQATGKRYLAAPGGTPVEIGSNPSAKILWRDGGFVALLGRMVFKITGV